MLVLGYCPSPHVTLWVMHVVAEFHELTKQTIISSVGCSQGFPLKDLWNNDHPPFTKGFLNGPTASEFYDECLRTALIEG